MQLLSLSNELLHAVARNLIPQTDTILGSYSLDTSVKECRLALLALAKVCQRLRSIAIPCLYHTVFVTDAGALFDFLGALVFNDHLTDLVRVLNVTAPLDEYPYGDVDEKSEGIFQHITSKMKA